MLSEHLKKYSRLDHDSIEKSIDLNQLLLRSIGFL